MTARLQSIRDRLENLVQMTRPTDQLGKLARRALAEANAGLEEYPQKPAVLIPTVYVDGIAYTADDVKDLLQALSAYNQIIKTRREQ